MLSYTASFVQRRNPQMQCVWSHRMLRLWKCNSTGNRESDCDQASSIIYGQRYVYEQVLKYGMVRRVRGASVRGVIAESALHALDQKNVLIYADEMVYEQLRIETRAEVYGLNYS